MVVASIICVVIFNFDWLRRTFVRLTGSRRNNGKAASFLLTETHLKLIRTRKWAELQDWAVNHKNLINNLRDGRGNSMLHYAVVYRPPPSIVRTLCEGTTLARCKNIDCELPLHWTFRAGARFEILSVLLEHCPDASTAVNKLNKSAFDMITTRQPRRASGESKRGFPVTISHSSDDDHRWRVLMMLLKAASCSSFDIIDSADETGTKKFAHKFNPLHVAVGLNIVPMDFINLILQRVEESSSAMISNDAHYKSSFLNMNNTKCNHNFLKDEQNNNNEEEDDENEYELNNISMDIIHMEQALRTRDANGRLPLHVAAATQMSNKRARQLLPRLLTMNPEAARKADNNGHLPLTLAIRTRKRWEGCIQNLLEVEPRALCVRDRVSRMVPFMVAAINISDDTDVDAGCSVSVSCRNNSLATSQQHVHKRARRKSGGSSKDCDLDFDEEMKRLEQLNVVYQLLKANPSACSMYINVYEY